ncbi:MAG TPA: FG-GAP-like repeat-containing protein [Terriglobales bacterium]|nr:FG-GAP-like repeat-containing protein [Terriglobales bacterium]
MRLLDFGSTRERPGDIALRSTGKTRHPVEPPSTDLVSAGDHFVNQDRRAFLIRFCQGASAALVPAGLRGFGFSSRHFLGFQNTFSSLGDGQLHLHPHYRAQTPLDAILLKTQSGLDVFITEKYQDQIAAILADWSSELLQSPQNTQAIEKTLTVDFSGSSPLAIESRLARSGAALEIRQNKFTHANALGRDAFLHDLRSTMSCFSKILTAEFQVVSIDAVPAPASISQSPSGLRTRVRYELVGSGKTCYREQRVGHLDLEWETSSVGDFRLKNWQTFEETSSRTTDPVFVDIAAQALGGNPSYSWQLLRGADYWRAVLDGACGIDIYGHNGVSVGDFDGDGFDDLYVCQPAGLPNRLYRNRGDGTFEDITEASGVGVLENTACALFADFDNDGRQDLLVVRTGGPLLFLNDGGGKFRQKTDAFQFATPPQGTFTGAATADYDRDGWLDIYFCLYIYYQGTDQYKYPVPYYDAENGPPNFMMRNNRDGTFRDVTSESGLFRNNTRYSFCCGWGDYNRDGWPDLYVVNDFGRKNLYRNNGDGTFTDVAPQARVEDVGAGMSVCWFDHDNDGAEELYVADMWSAAGKRVSMQDVFQKNASEEVRALYRKHAKGNSLFRNKKDGTFQDASATAGVEMGRWSWSSDAWDFDHDGFPDLYIANGMISGPSRPTQAEDLNSFFWRQVVANSPVEARLAPDYEQGWNALNELIRADETWSGFERNVFYANNRDGTFSDVSGAIGLDFLEDGRAFALADFDHDGRLEVFLKNRNGPQLRLLKNVMKDLAPSIAFCLRGSKSNRDAIGAAVTVETESVRQTRMLQAGSGFLSQHSKEVFFGLGEARGPVRASIRWPSGLMQELHDLPLNHRIWVEEGAEPYKLEVFKADTQGLKIAPLATRGAEAEPFPKPIPESGDNDKEGESLPPTVETWLVAPVSAPDFSLPDLSSQIRSLAELRGKTVLLNFWAMHSASHRDDLQVLNRIHARWRAEGLRLLTVNVDDTGAADNVRALARDLLLSFPILRGSDDVAGIYNILYRYLFDRHRDLSFPTSFLIDDKGDIVKVYQGSVNAEHVEEDFRHIPQTPAERVAKALPLPGVSDVSEFRRNYLAYGSVYFQRGYFDQAEASLRLALRDDPSSAEALYGLGSVYLKQQKTAEARESFERAIKLHASYPDTLPNAWNNLGLLAAQEGHTAEAISYFQEALRLSPDHLIALDNLGNAYRQQKQWDEARSVLERALKVSPQDPEANYSLGMVFAQLDDSDRAYEYLQRALKFRPAYPEALNNLGVLYLRTQRREQAVASFEECIRVAPTFDQSYLNLARVYALEAAPDKARAILLDLLKQHPDHAQAKKMLAELPR